MNFTTFRRGVAALALVAAPLLPLNAGASASPTFTTLVHYAIEHHVCVGTQRESIGTKVTPAARKVHVIDALSCETKSLFITLDYFSSPATLHSETSSSGFLTESLCRQHSNECAVSFAGRWLFIGLLSSQNAAVIAADEKALKADEALMSPSAIARG